MKVTGLLLMCCFLSFSLVAAEPDLYKMLINAKIVECLFIEGTFGKYDEEILKIEKYIMLGGFIFHSIDFKTKQARLWDDTRITEFLSSHAATFIEQDSIGMLIFTTVFPKYRKGTSDFIAVRSHHKVYGEPLSSQFHGSCLIRHKKY